MFHTLGQVAITLFALQVVYSCVLAYLWAPQGYRHMCDLPENKAALSKFTPRQREMHRRKYQPKLARRNALLRMWLVGDLVWLLRGQPQHVARIRVFALFQFFACLFIAEANGMALMEAAGVGALTGASMLALGALGVYSGRLTATEGDKRILGLAYDQSLRK